jgi:hypothetical protein
MRHLTSLLKGVTCQLQLERVSELLMHENERAKLEL